MPQEVERMQIELAVLQRPPPGFDQGIGIADLDLVEYTAQLDRDGAMEWISSKRTTAGANFCARAKTSRSAASVSATHLDSRAGPLTISMPALVAPPVVERPPG